MDIKYTNRIKWSVLAIVVVLIGGFAGWFLAGSKSTGKVLGVNTSYQAVFLSNGQVYFGKLAEDGSNWITLTDIYYLQTSQTQPLQQGATDTSKITDQSKIQLVKLGSELHGPEDVMHIERDKVLFWENMTENSKVVQAINSQTK
jgi:hypothetical protein